jgi:7,8-dihydropterin-6-yl-methyl-4-(beta-D-ribofuranosyl)aminobenzene 5'-phosphate synthase
MDDHVALRTVDSVEITLLVDNSIDLLLPDEGPAIRPDLGPDWLSRPPLMAEHGFASLVTLRSRGDEMRVLYDVGLTGETLLHNLSVLDLSLDDVQAIVLSHGHGDHHGGLEGLLRKVGKRDLPVLLHPDAWKRRKIVFPTGAEVNLPPPDRAMMTQAGAELLESTGPTMLLGETALVSGRVDRTTDFESGLPIHWAQGASGWEPDPMIWDDQNLVCHVKGRGLVVVSGCGHAGVINILHNAARLTGVAHLHAFVGGVHLSGRLFEPVIAPTVAELERLGPDHIVPAHCSGWRARQEIARRLPGAYHEPSVGTTYRFD